MEGFLAIRDFVDEWYSDIVNNVGDCSFLGFVTYESKFGTENFKTRIRIQRSGYDDGKISLDESGRFVSEKYHLDFSARFQTVEYDEESKMLIIKDQSSKMGKYKLQILPVP